MTPSESMRNQVVKCVESGRTVPLWVTILIALVVTAAVVYNSLTMSTSTDVLNRLNEVDEESRQDRENLNAEVKILKDQSGEMIEQVDRIEKQVQQARQEFVPADKIIDMVNENAAFPWLEERGEWLTWRDGIEGKTHEILNTVQELRKCIPKGAKGAGNGPKQEDKASD